MSVYTKSLSESRGLKCNFPRKCPIHRISDPLGTQCSAMGFLNRCEYAYVNESRCVRDRKSGLWLNMLHCVQSRLLMNEAFNSESRVWLCGSAS